MALDDTLPYPLFIICLNLFVVVVFLLASTMLDEAALWSVAASCRVGWWTAPSFSAWLRASGAFRGRPARTDAALAAFLSAILLVNMVVALVAAGSGILDLPHASHAAFLAADRGRALAESRSYWRVGARTAEGTALYLPILIFGALSAAVRMAHASVAPTTAFLLGATTILARALALSIVAVRVRDGGIGFNAPVPRSQRGWLALLRTTVAKGRLADNCAVCLSPLLGGDGVVVLSCLHAFHAHCSSSWERAIVGHPAAQLQPPPSNSPDAASTCRARAPPPPAPATPSTAQMRRALVDAPLVPVSSCPLCRAPRVAVLLARGALAGA